MTTTYTPILLDVFGNRVATIANHKRLAYTLNASPGGIGALQLTVPASFDLSLFQIDGRVGVLRSIAGRAPSLDNNAMFLIRRLQIHRDDTATITCEDATSLLRRRHILYYAGSAYSTYTGGTADNVIKAYVYQQMGAGISSANRIGVETYADVSAYLSIQGSLSAAPVVDKAAAWRNLLDVCRELAESSAEAGTYLTFAIVAPTESTLELRTWTTVRGVDHRATSSDPRIFSVARGNIENVEVDEDHTREVTFAAAGGIGEMDARMTGSYLDTARASISPFGRIEAWRDVSNVGNQGMLNDEAESTVRAGRPLITIAGSIVETAASTRGLQYDLGDLITVEHRGRSYDARLDLVQIVSENGRVTQQIGVRGV